MNEQPPPAGRSQIHLESGALATFLRAMLEASATIDARRAARQAADQQAEQAKAARPRGRRAA